MKQETGAGMKILKQGKIPPDPQEAWAEVTCKHCGTVFEFQRKEVKYGFGRPCDPSEELIECPLCKQRILVSNKIFAHRGLERGERS